MSRDTDSAPVPSRAMIAVGHPHYDPGQHDVEEWPCGCWEERSPRYVYAYRRCVEHGGSGKKKGEPV